MHTAPINSYYHLVTFPLTFPRLSRHCFWVCLAVLCTQRDTDQKLQPLFSVLFSFALFSMSLFLVSSLYFLRAFSSFLRSIFYKPSFVSHFSSTLFFPINTLVLSPLLYFLSILFLSFHCSLSLNYACSSHLQCY